MTNHNQENIIDIPSNIFLTKEEIVDLTEVSIHTLNGWIKSYKPNTDEVEIGKQNRRTYSKNYLLRLFDKINRQDLISLVSDQERLVKDKDEPSKDTSETLGTNQANTSVFEMLLKEKDARIKDLEEQVKTLKQEMQIKNDQIQQANNLANRQQTLSLQQNQLFLESKETKSGGLFGWFKGGNSKKNQNHSRN